MLLNMRITLELRLQISKYWNAHTFLISNTFLNMQLYAKNNLLIKYTHSKVIKDKHKYTNSIIKK